MLKQKFKQQAQNLSNVTHDVWILKLVDFSEKFGVGYLLSNGIIGVLFNDLTKLCIDPNNYDLDYFELNEQKKETKNMQVNTVEDYPETVPNPVTGQPESFLKKYKILIHFASKLKGISPEEYVK